VIEEGLKSTKRHLWTDKVVVSPIDLISQTRLGECSAVIHSRANGSDFACTWRSLGFRTPFLHTTVMSMFGRGSSAPSGAVNPERMEMAIQECVLISFTTRTASDPSDPS
jgi:hypothetical protein